MGTGSQIVVGVVVSLAVLASATAHGQQPAQVPVYGSQTPIPAQTPAPVRVIEQDLFVTDPTVAAPQHWVFGVGGEGWLTVLPGWPYLDLLSNSVKESTIYFHNIGGNISIGYDDLWAQISYRAGKGSEAQPFSSGTLHVDSQINQTQSEGEIKFRYLLRDFSTGGVLPMVPYLLAGYNYFKVDEDHRLETPGWYWSNTLVPDKFRTTTYQSGFIGFGWLTRFTSNIGMRIDISAGPTYAFRTTDNALPVYQTGAATDWGAYVNIHMTAYYSITENLIAQVGVKENGFLLSKENKDNLAAAGFFSLGSYGSLGYIQRF